MNKCFIVVTQYVCKFQFVEHFQTLCHSEPVRTLAWESVLLRLEKPRDALHRKGLRIATSLCSSQ